MDSDNGDSNEVTNSGDGDGYTFWFPFIGSASLNAASTAPGLDMPGEQKAVKYGDDSCVWWTW